MPYRQLKSPPYPTQRRPDHIVRHHHLGPQTHFMPRDPRRGAGAPWHTEATVNYLRYLASGDSDVLTEWRGCAQDRTTGHVHINY